MADIDPEEIERLDREKRIEELKRRAQDAAGGEMTAGGAEDCPPEVAEAFWKHVVAWEEAPWTTNFKQLEEAGIDLPDPERLDDLEISAKLWQVIEGLARLRVFLEDTNHLSDRELYAWLWNEGLREETKSFPDDPDGAFHLSPIGSGSEADTYIYLKHYADEEWREDWRKDYPDEPLPQHEDPPYDRDRHLPLAHEPPSSAAPEEEPED